MIISIYIYIYIYTKSGENNKTDFHTFSVYIVFSGFAAVVYIVAGLSL